MIKERVRLNPLPALAIAMMLASCDTGPVDSGGMLRVSFTSPAKGEQLSGVVEVRGTASAGAVLVELAVDAGAYSAALGTTLWTYSLDTAAFEPGPHRLFARATDSAGGRVTDTLDIVVAGANLSADLAGLVLSEGTLIPSFDAATIAYSASVANAVNSVTITPNKVDEGASITVQGAPVASGTASSAIDLAVGTNTITAADGTTQKTYTVVVTRAAAPTANANLSGLVLSAGNLSPSFDAATTSYNASVTNAVSSLTVTPTSDDAAAKITVQAVTVASGTASAPISLAVGPTTITVIVTAADGATQKAYSVLVIRAGQSVGHITASRTGGVAPLLVQFEADYTDEEFRANDFAWNFGDPQSGIWGTSNKPKNAAKGAITAHVFESPGTYTVTLTVKDAAGTTHVATTDIEVTDPDVVYAGTRTTCVNPAGDSDFTAAPTGSRRVSTNDLSSITQYATAGSRILFKRGSSWSTGGLVWPETPGPVTIGAYGAGTSPDELGIYANAPHITLSGSFLEMDEKQDYRIMDLTFTGNAYGVIGGTYSFQRNLIFRLKTTGFVTGIGWTIWNMGSMLTLDQLGVVSCDVGEAGSTSVYVGGERLMLLGNKIHDNSESHVLRVWQAYKSVISHNILSGSSVDSQLGRHAMKLHGPGYNQEDDASNLGTPANGNGLLRNRSEYIVISDNVFGGSGPWTVCVAPQNAYSDDNIRHVVLERNRFIGDYGTQNNFEVDHALSLGARYVTIRNNIFDARGGASWYTGMIITQFGEEPTPFGIEVYNNTLHIPVSYDGDNRTGIVLGETAQGTIVRNNLAYIAGAQGAVLIDDRGTGTVESNNQLNGTIAFVDATNANPLARSFAVTAGSSSAIDKGYTIPSVFDDFSGTSRPSGGAYDIGAFEQ